MAKKSSLTVVEQIEYDLNGQGHVGYIASPSNCKQMTPGVLVVHDWSGCNELAKENAIKVAEMGYVAFAVDMYGKGQVGQTVEEKQSLMMPLIEDRCLLYSRIYGAWQRLTQFNHVNPYKTGAIGFCLGGLCVLDLARGGAAVQGVVSIHGLLTPPATPMASKITSRVLALHGYDDPMVPPKEIDLFANEMSEKNVDWQLMTYGQTAHAFTNPEANNSDMGTVYSPLAAGRAWLATQQFLDEALSL